MPKLLIPANVMPEQIEGFPKEAERSVMGSLYIRPATTVEWTGDELEHVRNVRPDLAARFTVIEEGLTHKEIMQRRAQAGHAPMPASAKAEEAPAKEDEKPAPSVVKGKVSRPTRGSDSE